MATAAGRAPSGDQQAATVLSPGYQRSRAVVDIGTCPNAFDQLDIDLILREFPA